MVSSSAPRVVADRPSARPHHPGLLRSFATGAGRTDTVTAGRYGVDDRLSDQAAPAFGALVRRVARLLKGHGDGPATPLIAREEGAIAADETTPDRAFLAAVHRTRSFSRYAQIATI
ncbi:MAG: hypothetical protein AAF698_05575, partial [Pseudomonadota bacterium]